MAAPSAKSGLTATAPTFAVKGAHQSILLEMTGMGKDPASGRLLRGLTPYLDEQGAVHVFLMTERRRREPWGAYPDKVVTYQEIVHWARGPDGGTYRGVCSTGQRLTRDEIVQAFEYEPLALVDWAARRLEAAVVSNREPIALEVCNVPKPWGRETWYTGIERRGVSRVKSGTGSTPIPYALGMFPVPISGEQEEPPVLLKTLEPLPEPVYGDLYLEVHRQKWETYVVLEVSPEAWPDGVGRLRAGIDRAVLKRYHDASEADWESRLSQDLTVAIRDYEKVRRKIDAQLDDALRERGDNLLEPVPPELHKALLGRVPEAMREEERAKREVVEKFLGRVPLRPGDVVTLPPGVLHSLQHGVKVIEFQTPTYERLIAMFAQKVLTQPHWDVDEAVRIMDKAVYAPPNVDVLDEDETLRVERIVSFPEFAVDRVSLKLNRRETLRTEGDNQYQLLVTTEGKGELILSENRTFPLEPEQAYLMPATLGEYTVNALSAEGVTFLRATPRLVTNAEPTDVRVTVDDALERTW